MDSDQEEENFKLNKKRVSWQDELEEACGEVTWKQVTLGIIFGVVFYTSVYLALSYSIS